jgi:AcrR family transcriptional regulator
MERMDSMHPTKRQLLETTLRLMTELGPDSVTVDAVLEASGVSRGSLYHHFGSFPDFMDYANAVRYSTYVDASIAGIVAVVTGAKGKAELLEGARMLTRQTAQTAPNRADRLRILALAAQRPGLRALLSTEQQRLTNETAAALGAARDRGWLRPGLDTKVAAVLIQAYTLGKIVDDIAEEHIPAEAWEAMIMDLMAKVFFSEI